MWQFRQGSKIIFELWAMDIKTHDIPLKYCNHHYDNVHQFKMQVCRRLVNSSIYKSKLKSFCYTEQQNSTIPRVVCSVDPFGTSAMTRVMECSIAQSLKIRWIVLSSELLFAGLFIDVGGVGIQCQPEQLHYFSKRSALSMSESPSHVVDFVFGGTGSSGQSLYVGGCVSFQLAISVYDEVTISLAVLRVIFCL